MGLWLVHIIVQYTVILAVWTKGGVTGCKLDLALENLVKKKKSLEWEKAKERTFNKKQISLPILFL